jgi:hypothetical protein
VSAVVLVPYWDLLGAAFALAFAITTWSVLTWRDATRLVAVQTSLLPAGSS